MVEVERIPIVKLIDKDGYTCGLLFSTCTSGSWESQSTFDLIRLSETERLTYRTEPSVSYTFDSSRYRNTDWCSLNVMLIKWNGDVAERIAVGICHFDA